MVQCPNCGTYKTMPMLSFSGLVVFLFSSCLGCVVIVLVAPLLPVLFIIAALLVITDIVMAIMRKPRPYFCQKCHYTWTVYPEKKNKDKE